VSEDNFLGEEREKYIDMIVALENKLWIPMHVEPREHWEKMSDSDLLRNIRMLQEVENNPP
jgi:hypothetical protein